MTDYIDQYLAETIIVAQNIDRNKIGDAIYMFHRLRRDKGRLYVVGNGGSAANASHAVNDFRKITGIRAYSPMDNVAEMTARINDDGWDSSLYDWSLVEKITKDDMLLVLSVGGGSASISNNITRLMTRVCAIGAPILSIVSRDGGYAGPLSTLCIHIPVVSQLRVTPHAENWQMIIVHLLVNALVEEH
jgi:D-sedoheptulose 7-phosphate isomerase